MEPRIWLIAGPTASGKSALALRLAEASAARSSTPTPCSSTATCGAERAAVAAEEAPRAAPPVRDVDAADGWSVGRWQRAARETLAAIDGAGHRGRRHRALLQGADRGLADIPKIAADLRKAVGIEYGVWARTPSARGSRRPTRPAAARIARATASGWPAPGRSTPPPAAA
jgi:tRNA dimethylallyltransferase